MSFRKSQPESDNYGVEIFRFDDYIEKLNSQVLLPDIISIRPDVLRLKLKADDPEVFYELAQLPFPYDIHSVQHRNSTEVRQPDQGYELPKDLRYETATIADEPLLRKIIECVLENNTDQKLKLRVNYFSRQQYLQNTVDYLISFLSDASKEIWIMFENDNPAAFFSGVFDEDTFEGILYGVLPEFRGKGISNHIYQVMQILCAKKGIRYFVNDIIDGNWGSIKSASKIGMRGVAYLHVAIYPMLSGKGRLMNDNENGNVIWSETAANIESEPNVIYNYGDMRSTTNCSKRICDYDFDNVYFRVTLFEEKGTLIGHQISLWNKV